MDKRVIVLFLAAALIVSSLSAGRAMAQVSDIYAPVGIIDDDTDGLPDVWELDYLGSLEYGPLDDPDGDGYTNAEEMDLGTDPLNAAYPYVEEAFIPIEQPEMEAARREAAQKGIIVPDPPSHIYTPAELPQLSWPSVLSGFSNSMTYFILMSTLQLNIGMKSLSENLLYGLSDEGSQVGGKKCDKNEGDECEFNTDCPQFKNCNLDTCKCQYYKCVEGEPGVECDSNADCTDREKPYCSGIPDCKCYNR